MTICWRAWSLGTWRLWGASARFECSRILWVSPVEARWEFDFSKIFFVRFFFFENLNLNRKKMNFSEKKPFTRFYRLFLGFFFFSPVERRWELRFFKNIFLKISIFIAKSGKNEFEWKKKLFTRFYRVPLRFFRFELCLLDLDRIFSDEPLVQR